MSHLYQVAAGCADGAVAVDGDSERERAVDLLAVRQVGRQVIAHLARTSEDSSQQHQRKMNA